MIEIRRRVSFTTPQPVSVDPVPLRGGKIAARPPAPAEEAPVSVRHFANNSMNGRLSAPLAKGAWGTRWTAALPSDPLAVVRGESQILCQWPGAWRLFDAAGAQISEGVSGQSPAVVDPRSGSFQLITPALAWEMRHLSSGEVAYRNQLPYNNDYSWPLLLRSGNRMIAFASIRPGFGHAPVQPGSSLLQLIEIGVPMQTDPSGLVKNLTRFEALLISSADARAAAAGETIAMAAPNVLALFDTNLQVKAVYTGEFTPLQMSMDESGWMYLLVESGGSRSLWIVTPEGSRAAVWPASAQLGSVIQPPILGYDRRIYLLTAAQLVALDSEAKPLWTQVVPGGAAGAGVTIDGEVLVSTSNALLAFGPGGSHRELQRFNSPLTTPPVYTSHREIVVGGSKQLHCLAAR